MTRKRDSFEEMEAKKEAEYDSISGYLEKTKRVNAEIKRLRRLFSKIDKNKKSLVFTTISDIAFMTITMQDLRESIIREGTKVEYKNGENQYGTKQSPDAQLYLQLSQKQTQAMKLLIDCLPKNEKPVEKDDGFDDFVNGRDDV
ncbi:MAG: hypothetical protein ACOZCL_08510 [Bacillota bacterium]